MYSQFLQKDFPGNRSEQEFFSVGLHPWHVREISLAELPMLLSQKVPYPGVVAIGEVGLDKAKGNDLEYQKKLFRLQSKFAEERGVPVIIHCVKAFSELLELHQQWHPKVPWVVHGYSSSPEMALDLCDKGLYLSFGAAIFQNKKARESLEKVPAAQFFLETDEADVTIEEIYAAAAEIRQMPMNDLKLQIKENFKACFANG